MYSIVLYCIILYCIVLSSIVLYDRVSYKIVFWSITFSYIIFLKILIFRKYDPSAQLDRSDTSVYPDGYVVSLSSRITAVSRGEGALERDLKGRERGGKTPFLPIRRPKIL